MGRTATDRRLTTALRLRGGPVTVAVGDYLCSERELFRVEQLHEGHVLVENCRTGDLVDVTDGELAKLRRLERS